MGWVSFIDAANYGNDIKEKSLTDRLMPMSVFLSAAFQISTALQLFNWFSKRYLGTVLGVWLGSEILGLMSKFAVLGIFSFFPSWEIAEDSVGKA